MNNSANSIMTFHMRRKGGKMQDRNKTNTWLPSIHILYIYISGIWQTLIKSDVQKYFEVSINEYTVLTLVH